MMKKSILIVAMGLLSLHTTAQDTPKEEGFVFTTVKENPITSIKNQNRAGTCWCYSGLAFIESELLRMGKGEYDLSEMYIVHNTYPVSYTHLHPQTKEYLMSLVREVVERYDVDGVHLSLIHISFLGAGTYNSKYQYLLFDKNSKLLDYGINVYNASDDAFNMYTKYLANQGDLVMQPGKNVFAYSVNFSSNLDIVEIVGQKIKLIKSLSFADPLHKPMSDGTYQSVDLTENSSVGYITPSAT